MHQGVVRSCLARAWTRPGAFEFSPAQTAVWSVTWYGRLRAATAIDLDSLRMTRYVMGHRL